MHVICKKIQTKHFAPKEAATFAFFVESVLASFKKCSMVVRCFFADKITFLYNALVKVTPIVIVSVTKFFGAVIKNVVVVSLLN